MGKLQPAERSSEPRVDASRNGRPCTGKGPATSTSAGHVVVMRATVVLGVQSRLVVPVEARKELSLAAGDELVLHTEDGRLVLERREDAARRLRGRYASSATLGSVEELLTDRWQAAASE